MTRLIEWLSRNRRACAEEVALELEFQGWLDLAADLRQRRLLSPGED
jgi:hypothetical protein